MLQCLEPEFPRLFLAASVSISCMRRPVTISTKLPLSACPILPPMYLKNTLIYDFLYPIATETSRNLPSWNMLCVISWACVLGPVVTHSQLQNRPHLSHTLCSYSNTAFPLFVLHQGGCSSHASFCFPLGISHRQPFQQQFGSMLTTVISLCPRQHRQVNTKEDGLNVYPALLQSHVSLSLTQN